MDPYIEQSEYWHDFHTALMAILRVQLNHKLPPGYAAFLEERVYVLPDEDSIMPDALVVGERGPMGVNRAGTAVLERPADEPELVRYHPLREKEPFVEIRRIASRRGQVVAVIELLSPSNKQSGGHGRTEYMEKQSAVLASESHLLEIDLLRSGAHTVAAPRSIVLAKGPWDYLVCLHRAGTGNAFEVWRNFLRTRLPNVKVPLKEGDGDVELYLQAAVDEAYDGGPYPRLMDYSAAAPEPPLSVEDAAWADALLRDKGWRTEADAS